MKGNKYLAIAGAMIFGISGLAFAQQADNGRTANDTTVAHQHMSATAIACPCGHMGQNMAASTTNGKAGVEAKDNRTVVRPDDPQKNPWWEPRDWNYIANQNP